MPSDKDREEAERLVAGYYWCDRVWSAWGYGTMRESDFFPAEESDLVDDIVAAFARIRAEARAEALREVEKRICELWFKCMNTSPHKHPGIRDIRAAILADEPTEKGE